MINPEMTDAELEEYLRLKKIKDEKDIEKWIAEKEKYNMIAALRAEYEGTTEPEKQSLIGFENFCKIHGITLNEGSNKEMTHAE